MFYLQYRWKSFGVVFHLLAFMAALVFGNIASLSIYQIIKDNTVMMTNIHAIFLNPFFLITGAYIGVYFLYQLIRLTTNEIFPSDEK